MDECTCIFEFDTMVFWGFLLLLLLLVYAMLLLPPAPFNRNFVREYVLKAPMFHFDYLGITQSTHKNIAAQSQYTNNTKQQV